MTPSPVPNWNRLEDILSPQQVALIQEAQLKMGMRHPTWYPLQKRSTRAVDSLVNSAISPIAKQEGGEKWLRDLLPRLTDLAEFSHASSALAEIRAYGGLLEAGFQVEPIPRANKSTPDFLLHGEDGDITVEVFAKHQDLAEDKLLEALHSSSATPNFDRSVRTTSKGTVITTSVVVLTPAGKPDPKKPNDSVQANMVSRVCNAKPEEKQLPIDHPSVLILDFTHFGGPVTSEFLEAGQAAPLESGHSGVTCGAFWFGFYGWKGAPLFEEGERRLVRMQHDGRFRQAGGKKSKLSAVLIVLSKSCILLENPWASHPLSDLARLTFSQYPWFDISRSIIDWRPGDALALVETHKHLVEVMDEHYAAGRIPPWGA